VEGFSSGVQPDGVRRPGVGRHGVFGPAVGDGQPLDRLGPGNRSSRCRCVPIDHTPHGSVVARRVGRHLDGPLLMKCWRRSRVTASWMGGVLLQRGPFETCQAKREVLDARFGGHDTTSRLRTQRATGVVAGCENRRPSCLYRAQSALLGGL